MEKLTTTSPAVYTDFNGLDNLKRKAGSDPGAAAKEVAQQFESIFVGMMLKSMRDTLPKDGMFSSNQMDAYQDMFDKQLAVDMSSKGGLGLAEVIEKQIRASSQFAGQANDSGEGN
jgi:flagellar protein FlgJ